MEARTGQHQLPVDWQPRQKCGRFSEAYMDGGNGSGRG